MHFGGNRHTAESRRETRSPSPVPSCRPVRFGLLQGCPWGYSVSPKNQKGLTENFGGHGRDGVTSEGGRNHLILASSFCLRGRGPAPRMRTRKITTVSKTRSAANPT